MWERDIRNDSFYGCILLDAMEQFVDANNWNFVPNKKALNRAIMASCREDQSTESGAENLYWAVKAGVDYYSDKEPRQLTCGEWLGVAQTMSDIDIF